MGSLLPPEMKCNPQQIGFEPVSAMADALIDDEAAEEPQQNLAAAKKDYDARTKPDVDFAEPLAGQAGHEPQGQFSARTKGVFWTLAGVAEDDFTKEGLLKDLKAKCKGGCHEIIVAKEKHFNIIPCDL